MRLYAYGLKEFVTLTAASWVKKVGAAGSCNSLTDSCKFPTEEIMGAQNFDFPLHFRKMVGFQPQIFHFRTKVFRQEKNFRQFSHNCPPMPRPLSRRHATGAEPIVEKVTRQTRRHSCSRQECRTVRARGKGLCRRTPGAVHTATRTMRRCWHFAAFQLHSTPASDAS